MKTMFKKTPVIIQLLLIAISCLFTAAAQGTGFGKMSHYYQVLVLFCIFLAFGAVLFYMKVTKRLIREDAAVTMMILLGVLLRCGYVLLSGLYDRQHDAGVYTGMGTDFVNPGHIGYIEYIYKFHKLPDLNPYELFAYYHPPLHHLLSLLWLQVNIFLGVAEDMAFENLQVLTLLYSCLCMVVTHRILKILDIRGNGLLIGLSFVVFHPATIVMAGSVNNDMLTILFMCLTLYLSLRWIRAKNLKNLILLALSIGFGMLCKINTAIIALPTGLLFLLDFIHTIRRQEGNFLKKFWLAAKNYLLFALVSGSIGLSWIIRNLILFHVKPGISSATEASVMYTGNYSIWARIGIPAFSHWHFSFPFHPLSGDVIHNTWVIMFQTSLFAEVYPTELSGLPLMLCRFVYPLAILTALASAILFFAVQYQKWGNKVAKPKMATTTAPQQQEALFLSGGYLAFLLSFAAFSIKYPYTCSSDFRYVAICLVYIAIALGLGNKYYLSPTVMRGSGGKGRIKSWCMRAVNGGIILFLTFITLIYIFWERW